jgi:hypothetical protein
LHSGLHSEGLNHFQRAISDELGILHSEGENSQLQSGQRVFLFLLRTVPGVGSRSSDTMMEPDTTNRALIASTASPDTEDFHIFAGRIITMLC